MALSPVALIGGVGMIIVAAGFVGCALLRHWGWQYLLLGMLGWVVTVAVKVAIAIPLNPPVIKALGAMHEPWATVLMFLYGGLLTGITEVAIVWVVLRYTRLAQVSWHRVIAFGIGFGAIEAFLLGVGSLSAALVAMYLPDALPKAILTELAKADRFAIQLAPIWERFFTCLGHLATNVMIFYAARLPRVRWFWWAMIYKSAIDGVATLAITSGFLGSTANLWILEVVVALWGLLGVAVTIWIARRWPLECLGSEMLSDPTGTTAPAAI